MSLFRKLRSLPPAWWLACVLFMVALHRLVPGPSIIPGPLRYAGWAAIGLGAALIAWAGWSFKKAGTTVKPDGTPTSLVTGGPYRRTRNPMYLGLTFLLAGLALWMGSLTPWLGVAGFVVSIQLAIIPGEEKRAEGIFQEAYRAYKTRVRRWL